MAQRAVWRESAGIRIQTVQWPQTLSYFSQFQAGDQLMSIVVLRYGWGKLCSACQWDRQDNCRNGVVPEPSTLALFALAGLILAGRKIHRT